MPPRIMAACLICTALVLLIAVLPAEAGKKPEGMDLYKENCKVCHGKDSEHGEYTPMTLIQDQWTRFCEKKYKKQHPDLVHPEKDQKLSEVITPEMLEIICEFAVEHAADSENPMTCG